MTKQQIQQMECVCFSSYEMVFPRIALEECHHQGQCDDDIKNHVDTIDWSQLTPNQLRSEIEGYGIDEGKTDQEIREYALWIAAGNWQDEQFELNN